MPADSDKAGSKTARPFRPRMGGQVRSVAAEHASDCVSANSRRLAARWTDGEPVAAGSVTTATADERHPYRRRGRGVEPGQIDFNGQRFAGRKRRPRRRCRRWQERRQRLLAGGGRLGRLGHSDRQEPRGQRRGRLGRGQTFGPRRFGVDQKRQRQTAISAKTPRRVPVLCDRCPPKRFNKLFLVMNDMAPLGGHTVYTASIFRPSICQLFFLWRVRGLRLDDGASGS